MRIHLDTTLLISKPRFELLPPGDHEYLVSAVAFAEFSEGTVHPDPAIAAQARIEVIQHRAAYGEGLPFTQHDADIYRELCTTTPAGISPPSARRINLMIAAIAIGDGATLATRNPPAFAGLEPLLRVIGL